MIKVYTPVAIEEKVKLEFPRFWRVGEEKYARLKTGGSMGKSQPTYTKEFKQQAVQLFETSKKSKTQIARDLGISDSALSKWCFEQTRPDERRRQK
jgi:DNA invertase Pin-like site-specific DNA recombinase